MEKTATARTGAGVWTGTQKQSAPLAWKLDPDMADATWALGLYKLLRGYTSAMAPKVRGFLWAIHLAGTSEWGLRQLETGGYKWRE